jgi:Na+/H+ antiporter NhaC
MGTPICALVPLTAFAVFTFSIMQEYGVSPMGSNMLVEYMKVVPFMFYPISIILVALLLSLGILPRVGPLRAYYRERGESKVHETERPVQGSILDFALPVLVVVVTMFSTSDLVLSVILALVVVFALSIFRKKMTVTEYFDTFFAGIKDMVYILVVVLMTFVFVKGLENIGFSDFVVENVGTILAGSVLPALTFMVVGIIAFLGVDYWAVMLLFAPVALPLAAMFSVNPYLTMAAIVSGSVFGGTACFFAEQNLMCSQSVGRPPVRVAMGGLPYSLLAFVVTTALYLIVG